MRYKRFLLTVLMALSVQLTFANAIPEREFVRRNFPGFEEVFTHIMMNLETYCDDCFYGIAKKPEGYFLSATPFEEGQPTKYVKVWDRNAADFVAFDVLDFASDKRLGPEPPEEFKTNYQQANFYDFNLYYGYDGWIEDTRALLQQYPNKTAKDLEILARSYAYEATEAAHPGVTQNYIDLSGLFEDKGYAKVNNTQMQFFGEAANKSLEYWEQLEDQYPNYVGVTGDDIEFMRSNEYMHLWLLAKSIKASTLESVFEKNLYYSESWRQFALNNLNSCEDGGLLFTSASQDTYPLLYEQFKFGTRSDVVVINTSLLNASWYWEMLRETTDDLQTSIKNNEFEFLADKPFFVDRDKEALPYKQWLQELLKEDTEMTYRLAPRNFYVNYQGTNLDLELKTPSLFTSDIIILDLLANNPNRKAYSNAPYGMVSIGLYDHLAPTGRAFSLVSDKTATMQSIQALESVEQLVRYTTVDYLTALGTAAEKELSTLSYLIINISPVFMERRASLIDRFYQQITVKEMVKLEDFALLDALNAFYEVARPEVCEEIQVELKPLVEDKILNITAMSQDLNEDIETMERIFSIYAHFRVFDITQRSARMDNEAIELTEMEIAILKQLQEKAISLFESPVVRQRDLSRRKVYRLLRGLEALGIE
ncbi:MAG: hypothetical protein NXI10_17270 [bacterium]|nr:hypothetical protein [bacterium]